MREDDFPLGARVTIDELDDDPHPVLALLREREPVSWLPALECWLVTAHDQTLRVMRDAVTYTVDDPRFSTGQVVGPSMLTLDGDEHARHREPFAASFSAAEVRAHFHDAVVDEVDQLIDAIEARGGSDLRTSLTGPVAVASMVRALGLEDVTVPMLLAWYAAIVDSVTTVTAGGAVTDAGAASFDALRRAVERTLAAGDGSLLATALGLSSDEVVSNAAVLLFGGIETTDAMIANAIVHLVQHPDERSLVEADPALVAGAVEESLRLEPAAAVIDRYATTDATLAGAEIAAGELVRVSIAGANRDPAVFADPDRFDVRRRNVRRHIAFAHGPHVCLGLHLARLEATVALERLLARLPGLRFDESRPTSIRGLVFRKPPTLHVCWT